MSQILCGTLASTHAQTLAGSAWTYQGQAQRQVTPETHGRRYTAAATH